MPADSSGFVDGFSKFKRFLVEDEKTLHKFCGISLSIFTSLSFIFSSNFSIILILMNVKLTSYSFQFEFCLMEIILRPFISLITKFEVYNVLTFQIRAFPK